MVAHGLLQNGERTLADLMLLECAELSFIKLRFWDMNILTGPNAISLSA
jgi:hypothetical protein